MSQGKATLLPAKELGSALAAAGDDRIDFPFFIFA